MVIRFLKMVFLLITAELVKIDGKNQYAAYFIVLNQDGLVVAHAPTQTQSLKNEAVSMLEKLSSKNKIKRVFTDRCCEEKNIIQSIFGSNTIVNLDIRHFNDRINRTLRHGKMSKDEKANFRNDVSLLTRQKHDKNVKRQYETACPDEITQNIDKMLDVYSNEVPQETIKGHP